jgi:hypothetical protein
MLKQDFTPDLIIQIRKRIASGNEYQQDIAAELGCNQGRISEIKNNAEWVQKVLDTSAEA